jgi:hypothetical protein
MKSSILINKATVFSQTLFSKHLVFEFL